MSADGDRELPARSLAIAESAHEHRNKAVLVDAADVHSDGMNAICVWSGVHPASNRYFEHEFDASKKPGTALLRSLFASGYAHGKQFSNVRTILREIHDRMLSSHMRLSF